MEVTCVEFYTGYCNTLLEMCLGHFKNVVFIVLIDQIIIPPSHWPTSRNS